MLNGIHLVDYGNHRDTRLTFGRMTALVGQNGAGKTNVMRGIGEIGKRGFNYENAEDAEAKGWEDDKVRSKARKWAISASWPGSLKSSEGEQQKGTWGIKLSSLKQKSWLWQAGLQRSGVWIPDQEGNPENTPLWDNRNVLFRAPGSSSGKVNEGSIVRPLGEQLDSSWICQYFKTAGSHLQEPSYSELSPPNLSEDCRDLAWMIAYLKGDKDEVFADITQALQKVVPTFRRVRHRPALMRRSEKKEVVINKQPRVYDEEQTVMGQELRFDMASGSDLRASAISEGTLITLAILTAILHDDAIEEGKGTKTILLDDIESGLHPSAQRDLIRQLRRLQETRPELQIIFSSHSPYIIDEMKPEDVWLFAPDKEGIAHCGKLSDHPNAKRGLEVLTTGEFWSAEGESWVLNRARQVNKEAVAAK